MIVYIYIYKLILVGNNYNPWPSGVITAYNSIMADVLIIVKHLSLPAKRFDSMMCNNFIPRSTKVKQHSYDHHDY